MTEELLRLENVSFGFAGHGSLLRAADLSLAAGQALAVTGPSGCGKSLLARVLCGLPPGRLWWRGRLRWQGHVLEPGQEESAAWQAMRGTGVALVPQEPATGLNPVRRVGDQIAEAAALWGRKGVSPRAVVLDLLREVRIPHPRQVARRYAHELSGGMRQRVLLAAALACRPRLLVADEITTALDPPVQRDVLLLVREICRRRGMALLFISHDPDLVAWMTDRAVQIVGGRLREGIYGEGGVGGRAPSAGPRVVAEPAAASPVLEATDLHVLHRSGVAAVRGVDLVVRPGEAVGLAGESGSGKTSLARALARQIPLTAGALRLGAEDFLACRGARLRRARRRIQLLFQDPGGSLNPRLRVGRALREAGLPAPAPVADLLREVDLDPDLQGRYPHQLSGGQRQRVALARALAADPAVLMADEPTSALDPVSTARILDLLDRARSRRHLGLLLISHDLRHLLERCDRVLVMLEGVVLEEIPAGEGIAARHPYTRALLAALPAALRAHHPGLLCAPGTAPSGPSERGRGCPFAPTCREAISTCFKELPALQSQSDGRLSRCPHEPRA